MQRKLITIHLFLAAFFFPIALMFASTGGLYTLSIKGAYEESSRSIALQQPLEADHAALVGLAQRELDALGLAAPTGAAGIKKAGTSFEMEWTGVERDVVLKPTADPQVAKLVVKETTPWRHFVQLHKAKGSAIARGISVVWAVGLVLILLSGLLMALRVPGYRRQAMVAGSAGVVTFIAYAMLG